MNIFDKQLDKIKKSTRIGIMAHVVIGYPSLKSTVDLVKVMAESGVDIVELQIPFSDPLADGPTIMRACEQSLESGTRVKDSFEIMKELSAQVEIPLLFMSYYNPVFKYGVDLFCQDAERAGAAGLIVPDMPIEEESEEHFFAACKKYGLSNIRVVSPASTEERFKKNAEVGNGFIYCTAKQGITGASDKLNPEISEYLQRARKHFDIPIAVGFGISNHDQIKQLVPYADIAIVGSAVIDLINKTPEAKRSDVIKRFFLDLQSY